MITFYVLEDLKFHFIKDPGKVDSSGSFNDLKKEESRDRDTFVVPDEINELNIPEFNFNQKLLVYKIGFLFEVLKKLYPDYNMANIYNIIRFKYQVYVSDRKMRFCITQWNKNRDYFLAHVSNKDR